VVLSAPLLRCSKCHQVCYCCRACQKQAWKAGHKHECGQLALEATASAAAAQLRETVPDLAAIIYGMLGCGCSRLGQTNKAIGLCEQGLALAEDAGDRACTGMICDSPE